MPKGIHEREKEWPKQQPAGGLKPAGMEEGAEMMDSRSLRGEGTSWRPWPKVILEKERTLLAEVTALPHPYLLELVR